MATPMVQRAISTPTLWTNSTPTVSPPEHRQRHGHEAVVIHAGAHGKGALLRQGLQPGQSTGGPHQENAQRGGAKADQWRERQRAGPREGGVAKGGIQNQRREQRVILTAKDSRPPPR